MELYQIITTVITLVLGGLGLYFKYNKDLNANVMNFIDEAEELYQDFTKAGGQKFEWVVTRLYGLIPAFLRKVFTRQMLTELIQRTFDAAQSYAKKQLDKATDNENK